MSDDGLPGVAMVAALLVGTFLAAGLALRSLLWFLVAMMVLVQG